MENKNVKDFTSLSAEEREILNFLLEEEGVEIPGEQIILPREESEKAPLSFAQQRLWFLDQLEPGSPFYNLPKAFRLEGSLDLTALRYSLSEVIRRHEVLRTTFDMIAGEPVQVISPPVAMDLPLVDLTGLSKEDREEEVMRLANEESRRPFDLRVGPLLRAATVKVAEQDHVMLFTIHHIISDAWSAGVFIGEVVALYGAFSAGKPSPLADLPIQYADFACWQRQWLQGEVLQKQLSYWKSHLAGNPPVLELPADRIRPAIQTFKGATQPLQLSKSITDSLRKLNREEGTTFFMLLLAAFKALLYRYTSESDIVVGFPIANRNRPEIEQMIGFFANTLVLRTSLSGNPTFRQLLNRVRDVVLEAQDHQDLPFENLVDELQPERNMSHNPLFEIMFIHNNAPVAAEGLRGITLSPIEVNSGVAKFDFILFTQEAIDGVGGSIIYNTDLFNASTVARMVGHYQNLLEGATANPDVPISELPMLTEAERRQLREWNNTARDYQAAECVHHILEQQTRLTPHSVAAEWRGQKLTYEQLNSKANQLARYLKRCGVGPEALVGIHLNRTSDLMVAILGVMKAGGAYVPIDPAYPAERVAFMLEDSNAAVVLTHQHLGDRLTSHNSRVVSLDDEWEQISREGEHNLDTPVTAENLAYVFYTSGSTGKPKGVGIEHRSVVAFIEWGKELYGAEDLARTLASTSICFDLSVFELMVPLSTGGTVVIVENALEVGSLGADAQISLINTVPSAMREVVRARAVPDSVRVVNHCGEPLPRKLVEDIYESSKVEEVWNLYGPTEYTTYATQVMVKPDADAIVTIGRPLSQTQIYILDSYLHEIPIGVTGDLYISGKGLARGYMKRPDLTADRFIPDPFSSEPGARMYKTGDKARYLPSGEMDFLGRVDHQVKIRGFRIETGEIEAALSHYPQVKEVAVMAREDVQYEKYLAAYLVFEQGAGLDVNNIRYYLAEKLPEHMIPRHFIELDFLPLTPNGKVDRRQLPAPSTVRPDLGEAYEEARTPIQEVLAQIWADVLDLKKVGINDNFFELGGHSLLATKLNSRLRDSLKVNLPLRALFEAPTVARLAGLIETAMQGEQSSMLPPILPAPRDLPLPLSFAQERLWFLSMLEPESAVYNIHHAIQLRGDLDVAALEQSFTEVIRRHEVLRTSFSTMDGQWVQVINPARPFNFPIIDLKELTEDERRVIAMSIANEEAQRPFDTTRDTLLRASVLRSAEDDHMVLLTIHHTIVDAWSIGLLVRELTTLYDAFSKDLPSPLPELEIQYADYANWQRQWIEGDTLEKQLSYWKHQLGGDLAAINLPTDRPRPAAQTFRGATESRFISGDLLKSLKRLSSEQGCTFFMTLLAAFKVLLHRYSNQDDIVIGTPIAGRNRTEIEDLIGLFLNTLVLRTDLSGDPSFAELLGRVREVSLSAYVHQDMPFEKLVGQLQPERDLSRSPLFQVMFILQNAAPQSTGLSGLDWNSIAAESKTAKFDLSLQMFELESGLVASLQYNTDLFDAATIERMLCHYERLLKAVTADPSQPIYTLPMLTASELDQLLIEFNNTEAPYAADACIHQLFEAQAELTPDAVALSSTGDLLTYTQLNARANQLAHFLRSKQVRPGVLVGVCLTRDSHLIVALLAILKSGGAYVPLDPDYPQQRVTSMLEDSAAAIVLTQESLRHVVSGQQCEVIELDTQAEEIAAYATDNVESGVSSDDLAYVIFTSGSTGRPKGVAIEHHSTVAMIDWASKEYSSEELAVVLASTSICFDLSVYEIMVPLCVGGRIVLVNDALEVGRQMCDRHLSLINTVPSAMSELVGINSVPESVRTVNLAGEPLQAKLVEEIYKLGHVDRVLNLYGPSEDTTYSTYEVVRSGEKVTIGRPVSNGKAYVLGEGMQLAPVGVTGELYLGGEGLARCYLNQADMTAERFVPNPYGRKGGERLYRTGDLVRYRADGKLEYLGRADHQVKVRGYRIELNEIEAALMSFADIKEAVVLAEGGGANRRLVAFYVSAEGNKPSAGDLRTHLKHKLPDYMIPSSFVKVDKIPLNPNGKIDRKALAAVEHARPESEGGYAAPRTPVEEVVAGIWKQVLGLEEVGIEDNFFEMGGHSLLATQVVSRVRKVFGVELALKTVFERQTIAAIAQEVEEAIREGRGGNAGAIGRANRDGRLALSYAQERLWFIDQLEPGNATNNVPAAVRLTGELDVKALEDTLTEIMRRHEVLRTVFAVEEGAPVQKVRAAERFKLEVEDLSSEEEEKRELEVGTIAREEAGRGFDLQAGPLLRVRLMKLGETEHVVVMTMHHIISDGWSIGVMVREMAALYAAYVKGEESPLEELKIQYADYAVWQREWLQGEELDRQVSYWRAQLGGAPAVLELPTDRPRPSVQTYRGASEGFLISEEVTKRLKELSRAEGVTLYMTLLAAYKVLLMRYTNQRDIVVGADIANRNHEEIEGLIGFFVNMMVLRTDLTGEPTFRELLNRVRSVALGAYTHQDLPFEKLVEELKPERSLSHSPLFQVSFVLQNAPVRNLELPGLSLAPVKVGSQTSQFDISLMVAEQGDQLVATLKYNSDLFNNDTIKRMSDHFQRLLKEVVADPDQAVTAVRLLSEEQEHQIVFKWNDTASSYPLDVCVHALFEQQAKLEPNATAVVYGQERVSYKVLNERSNQLARHLRNMGVGPETVVGICLDRNVEMMIGLLGILKAGGAYLPLDPNYPLQRLAWMLEDASASVLLTQESLLVNMPTHWGWTLLIDSQWEEIAQESGANLDVEIEADNMAYVIYTSGSTGVPKGVSVTHKGLTNYLQWSTRAYPLMGKRGGAPLHSSISFDLTVTSLYAPLLTGGCVEILAEGIEALRQAYEQKRDYSLVKMTPVHAQLLGEELKREDLGWCRGAMILGGENLMASSIRLWREKAPGLKIYNEYGPTETVVGCCVYEVMEEDEHTGAVPIGRAIANTELHILDENKRLAPIGVTGELHIGGAGLARGYMKQPELTADRFIPNPFSREAGARLYKTGDMARYLADGKIEYLGRVDDQVKVRGYRIELGEIEAALMERTDLQDAVVVARPDKAGNKRLVAYVVSSEDMAQDMANELKQHLKARLPNYMIPAAFVTLDRMPLSPNGKVDRRLLPPPDEAERGAAESYVAPGTPLEEMIAQIWQDVLEIGQVGARDNFFDLGGHSLLAMQVISRLHDGLQIDIPLREMFENPTVEQFAAVVEQVLMREVEELSEDEAQRLLGLED